MHYYKLFLSSDITSASGYQEDQTLASYLCLFPFYLQIFSGIAWTFNLVEYLHDFIANDRKKKCAGNIFQIDVVIESWAL